MGRGPTFFISHGKCLWCSEGKCSKHVRINCVRDKNKTTHNKLAACRLLRDSLGIGYRAFFTISHVYFLPSLADFVHIKRKCKKHKSCVKRSTSLTGCGLGQNFSVRLKSCFTADGSATFDKVSVSGSKVAAYS